MSAFLFMVGAGIGAVGIALAMRILMDGIPTKTIVKNYYNGEKEKIDDNSL